MIDPVLFNGRENDEWHLDINIQHGDVELMPRPDDMDTKRQRKAVLAFQITGTIPGDWGRGVNWPSMLATGNMAPLAEAMMQVQVALSQDEGSSADGSFAIPIFDQGPNGEAKMQLLTVSPDDLKELQFNG